MRINTDLVTGVLDTLAFFFVTPDLIGKERLDAYGRRIDRWLGRGRTFVIKVLRVLRPGIFLLTWLILIAMFLIMGPVMLVRHTTDIDLFALWGDTAIIIVIVMMMPIMVFFLILLLYTVVSVLRVVSLTLVEHDLSGILLLTGALLFLLSRGLQISHSVD